MTALIRLYLSNYIHLGVAVTLFTAFTWTGAGNQPDWLYAALTGLMTLWLYKNHQLITCHRTGSGSMPSHLWTLTLFVVAAGTLYFWYTIPGVILPMLSACSLTAAYFIRYRPLGMPWRTHLLLKPLIIGAVYLMLTVAVPLIMQKTSAWHILSACAGRFFFIVAISVMFDAGDITEDCRADLVTIPQRFGIEAGRIAALLLMVSACAAEWLLTDTVITGEDAVIALGMTFMATGLLVLFIRQGRSYLYFYLLLVDGMLALPWLIWKALEVF